MLPAKLKTFHDDLIDGVHTLERGGFCFFSLFSKLFGKSGADISFYQSITTLLCQADAQVHNIQTFCFKKDN